MNIYTLVLDEIHNHPIFETFTDAEKAKDRAKVLAMQFPFWKSGEVKGYYLFVEIDLNGSSIYIKETELIGTNEVMGQVKLARDIAKASPDLKKGDYDNEVLTLNNSMDEIFIMLDELVEEES